MSFKDHTANLHATIRHLILLNVVLGGALIATVGLAYQLYQGLAISIPPDLKAGAMVRPGEQSPEDVFAFTTTVFLALQHWRQNGTKDYPANIERLRPFMTERFRNLLKADLRKKDSLGELEGIERTLALPAEYVFDSETVTVVNNHQWIVKVPFEVKEYVKGTLIKDVEVLYSFVITRLRININQNAHQIGLDRFYEVPIRTKNYLSDSGVVKQDVRKLIDEL